MRRRRCDRRGGGDVGCKRDRGRQKRRAEEEKATLSRDKKAQFSPKVFFFL